VVATIAVDRSVVLREDTWVGLEFQGLTGIAAVSLRGGSAAAPPLTGNPPVLRADLSAGQDVTQAAREVLRKLDALVSANEASVKTSLRNIETFTNTLADNSERIDRILAGAEKFVGSAETKLDDFASAARAVRTVADNLDKHTAEISVGLTRFSQFGLREWEKLATDGRRAISVLEQTVKNIDQNPSRLLFGGAPKTPAGPRAQSNAAR
jgi:phospholipid/cholesterol/gamma-HCH transport system substrate-binding protein